MAEEKMRVREGYRFSAIGGFKKGANAALRLGVASGQFCAIMLSDGFVTKEKVSGLEPTINREALKRTAFFIDAPDKGNYFEGNGNLHVVLRDKDVYHEYRVREGDGGFDWFLGGLPEIIQFTAKRFHK